jgi:hypothetical protein
VFPFGGKQGCDDHDWLSVQPFGKLVWDLVQPAVRDWIDHDWSILCQAHPVIHYQHQASDPNQA